MLKSHSPLQLQLAPPPPPPDMSMHPVILQDFMGNLWDFAYIPQTSSKITGCMPT